MMMQDVVKSRSSLLYLERYVNTVKDRFSEVNPEFKPIEGSPYYALPYVLVDKDKISVKTVDPMPGLVDKIFEKDEKDRESGEDKIRFFLHPGMQDKYDISEIDDLKSENIYSSILVSPTASTRTVSVFNEKYMVKLNLDKLHSRYVRRLRANSVEHSLLVSEELMRLCSDKEGLDIFAYLPESVGVVCGDDKHSPGYILREMIPKPLSGERRYLAPFFSLYGQDMKNKDDKPLLIQLIEKSGKPAIDYFIQDIIDPLIHTWVYCLKETGIMLESHGQNTLVELNNEGGIERIVMRDFQSLMIDEEIRKEKGLEKKFKKHIVGEEDGITREQEYSLVYDRFVGHYLIGYLTKTLCQYYDYTEDFAANAVKEVFKYRFPDHKDYFPKEEYAFAGKIFQDNVTKLKVISDEPRFR